MSLHRWLAVALVLVMTPGAALAKKQKTEAAPGKLYGFNLFGPLSLLGISGLLTHDALEFGRSQGMEAASADDAESKVGRDNLKKIRQCDLRAACIQSLSSALGEGRLIVGTLSTDDVHYVVRLELIDLASGALVASAERQVLIASRSLEQEFKTMLPDLFAGKSVAPTKLTLTSPQKHVRAQIDDQPLGELPVTIDVSPGRHEVRAEKIDYLSLDRFVEVPAEPKSSVELPLTLIPGRVDPDEAVAAVPPVPNANATKATHAASANTETTARAGGVPVGSWVSLGIAVAAVGAGTYFGLSEKSIASKAVDNNKDGALDITRAQAIAGGRDATLANISFVVAGAAVVTGALFYFTDDGGKSDADKSKPKLSLAPISRGGVASLQVGF